MITFVQKLIRAACIIFMVGAQLAYAQSEASASESSSQTVVDPNFFASPRAKAMGGAIAPFAVGNDAAWYNPAGIGGRGREKLPFMRQVQFPYVSAAVNENSIELNKQFSEQGEVEDGTIGSAIIDAHAGKRQYGRFSLFPNIGFGRVLLGPIVDQQLAAVPKGEGSDLVDTHYRSVTGFGAGASFSDTKGRLQLGIFTTQLDIKEIKGDFEYSKIIDTDLRKEAIADYTYNYSGSSNTVGLMWLLGKKAEPTLSIVGRNVAGTKYAKSNESDPDLEIEEDWSLGIGLSPRFGRSITLNFAVQADRLTESGVNLSKKVKAGIELNFGTHPFRPMGSIRAGYTAAGASYGAGLNIGLLGADYSSYAEDVGVGNDRIIERRREMSATVDLAEF